MTLTGSLHEKLVFGRRTQVLAGHLEALLPEGAHVLDVGCGDGTIDRLILQDRHDLRVEGVVVEPLHGADDLAGIVAEFAPTAERRLGILLDHLVRGSKETRIAEAVLRGPHGAHVRIVGHPFIDIWQAIKPARLGIPAWPDVPKGEDWKRGTLRRLGMPHESQEDVGRAWQRMRTRVRDWNDLEPALLARVEELIDFVTTNRH